MADKNLQSPQKDKSNDIISKSEIIYSSVIRPTSLILPVNTNLNLAPSNWLSSATEHYGLQNMFTQSGFSSFQLADNSIDYINKVDIVSDAENIKQLLKMPFSEKSVSMMVHRVGNTLLIDEFDAAKYMVVQPKNWNWLKKFFSDHISGETEKYISRVNSFNVIQEKTLKSKFLYYSIDDSSSNSPENDNDQCPKTTQSNPNFPNLPIPFPDEQFPNHPKMHQFNQTMLWNFGDLQMLIGSDLPIFEHGTSFQSLRLKDLSKYSVPMNNLHVVDHWLDNLMCNVSEVLLCHHLNGIVQKYEKVKTEELPNLEDKFLPSNFKNIAQNLLSFLKSKISKVGHTYWLYKGKNETMITTYDLTSLCFEPLPQDQNLLTIPVAMLLYRIAYRWLNSPVDKEKNFNDVAIESLLNCCAKLFNKTIRRELHLSINYMMSEILIPKSDDIELKKNSFVVFDDTEHDQNDYRSINSIDKFNLCILHHNNNTFSESEHFSPKSVKISQMECVKKSFYFIECGLKEIQCKGNIVHNPKIDNLGEPNYSSLSSTELKPNVPKVGRKKRKKNRKGHKKINRIKIPPPDEDALKSWSPFFRKIFLKKANFMYIALAYTALSLFNYGYCLKYLRLGLECEIHYSTPHVASSILDFYLKQCGICCIRIAHWWSHYSKRYTYEINHFEDFDQNIKDFLKNECKNYSHKVLKFIPENLESKYSILKAAENCFNQLFELYNSSEARDKLTEIYHCYTVDNINNLLNSFYKSSTALNMSELVGMIKMADDYFALEMIKEHGAKDLSVCHINMGAMYSLVSAYILKVNPGNRANLEEIYEKKGIEFFDKSYEFLDKCKGNLNDWNYSSETLFDNLYTMAMTYRSLCSDAEVPSIDVRTIFWLEKCFNCYSYIAKVKTKPEQLESIANIKTCLGDLYFKQLNQYVIMNNLSPSDSLNRCCKMYDDAYDMYMMTNFAFKALDVLNKKILLEEFMLTNGIKSRLEYFHTAKIYLGKLSLTLYMPTNPSLNEEYFKAHNFNPTEFFITVGKRLAFLLKHMTKESLDETSILAGKKDQIKKMYYTLIQKKTDESFAHLLETINQVTTFQFK